MGGERDLRRAKIVGGEAGWWSEISSGRRKKRKGAT